MASAAESITLWEIGASVRECLEDSHFDESTGALLPEWQAQLDESESDMEAKALNCAAFAKELAVTSRAIRDQAQHLTERARRMDAKRKWLIAYMERELRNASMDKNLGDDRIEIKWRNSAHVEITEEGEIPEEFLQREIKIKRSEILKCLRNHEVVQGAEIIWDRKLSIR